MSRKKTTEQFIEQANEIHNNRFNYDKVLYKNNSSKVEIVCSEHGSFFQNYINHINNKAGCPLCKRRTLSLLKTKTRDKFVEEALKRHDNKYDYSKVEYFHTDKKITILCPIHGVFEQTPHDHLNGKGCRECSNEKLSILYKKTNDDFIEQANKVHNKKYLYDQTKYDGIYEKIKILCPKHGVFEQRPNDHLGGHGCSKCCKRISNKEQSWLDSKNIPANNRQVYIKIPNHKYKVDGYDPATNTIYEFLGDFWHGNLNKYNKKDLNPINKKTFGSLYEEWLKRKQLFEENGYKVEFIWESDFV